MKRGLFILLATVMIMTACKDKKQSSGKETEQQAANAVADPAKDSAEIKTVIRSFYNWYNSNYPKLMKFDLYDGVKKKDAPPYKINWEEVEKYQQFIRDSIPQLSDEFLANQKHFFERCDSAFKKDVEDDIPYGFDYDWYTNSQEDPQYITDQVNTDSLWTMMIEVDQAIVRIHGSQEEGNSGLPIRVKKENGNWKIVKIGSDD